MPKKSHFRQPMAFFVCAHPSSLSVLINNFCTSILESYFPFLHTHRYDNKTYLLFDAVAFGVSKDGAMEDVGYPSSIDDAESNIHGSSV